MKALVKFQKGAGNVELRNIPIPIIEDGEALIQVIYCGICGTDIHLYYDLFKNKPPFILGHEFAGKITKVGKDVSGWQVGDRIVSENNPFACQRCYLCRTGYPNMCPDKRPMGIFSDGCFAEYLKLPAWLLHRIPENVTDEESAITEPLAVVIHAILERGQIKPGDFVVVIGPGPVGLLAAQVAKVSGATKVMIIGTQVDTQKRLKVAEDIGIEYIVNADRDDPVKYVMDLTNGLGADVIIEASGNEKAISSVLTMVRRLGKIICIGITGKENISVAWDLAIQKGVNFIFSFSSTYSSWRRALSFLSSNMIKIQPLISEVLPLEEWKNGFYKVEKNNAIKVLLKP